jgi:hypothetical protein
MILQPFSKNTKKRFIFFKDKTNILKKRLKKMSFDLMSVCGKLMTL